MESGIIRAVEKHRAKIAIVALLVILFLLMQAVGTTFFHNAVNHSYPQGYGASDAYWALTDVSYTMKNGVYKDLSPPLSFFSKTAYPIDEPPLLQYVAGGIGTLLGIESYDAINLGLILMVVVALFGICALLFEIEPLAMLVFLPYVLLVSVHPYSAVYSWGFWRQEVSMAIMIFSVYFLAQPWSLGRAVWLGALAAASAVAYPLYAFFFVALFFIIELYAYLRDRRWKRHALGAVVTGATGLVLAFPYLLDFAATRTGEGGFLQGTFTAIFTNYYPANAGVYFSNMLWPVVIALGVLVLLLTLALFRKMSTDITHPAILLLSVLALTVIPDLIGGYMGRGYQLRWLWPIILFGTTSLAVYIVLRMLVDNNIVRAHYAAVFVPVACTLLLVVTAAFILPSISFTDKPGQSICPETLWKAMGDVSTNTPPGSTVLVIDPTLTQDAVVMAIERPTDYMNNAALVEAVTKNLTLDQVKPGRICMYSTRRFSFVPFGWQPLPDIPACKPAPRQPCSYDYIVLHTINNDVFKTWLAGQSLGGFVTDRKFGDTLVLRNKEGCA